MTHRQRQQKKLGLKPCQPEPFKPNTDPNFQRPDRVNPAVLEAERAYYNALTSLLVGRRQ